MGARRHILPPSLAPIGLNREEAAAYVGLGITLFDRLVSKSLMPQPREAGGRLVWDVAELQTSFRDLPHRVSDEVEPVNKDGNPWDDDED